MVLGCSDGPTGSTEPARKGSLVIACITGRVVSNSHSVFRYTLFASCQSSCCSPVCTRKHRQCRGQTLSVCPRERPELAGEFQIHRSSCDPGDEDSSSAMGLSS